MRSNKILYDPAGLKADYVIEADPLQIQGNKSLINECEKIIFENEWIKIDKLNLIDTKNIFIPSLDAIKPLVDRISQKKLIDSINIPSPKWISFKDLIKTLLRAFMMIININNFKIFNKTEMKVISSVKK